MSIHVKVEIAQGSENVHLKCWRIQMLWMGKQKSNTQSLPLLYIKDTKQTTIKF